MPFFCEYFDKRKKLAGNILLFFSFYVQTDVTDSPCSVARAACSFGYGVFNLAMSLLPDKVLGLMKLLGFHGDRTAGLQALQFAARSNDMRAPMAM